MKNTTAEHIKTERFLLPVLIFLLMLFMTGPAVRASASSGRVIDQANLFSSAEKAELETDIAKTAAKIGMDVVVLTTDNTNGLESEKYAENYYDQNGYGTGSSKSGFLYLIDMQNRVPSITAAGGCSYLFTDERVQSALDDVYENLSEGDYAGSVKTVLKDAEKNYNDMINKGYTFDPDTGKPVKKRRIDPLKAAIALIASFFTAGGSCLGIKHSYEMKGVKKQSASSALAYRAASAFAFASTADQLINKQTTQRVIPVIRDNESNGGFGGGLDGPLGHTSTHMSDGGVLHSGGTGRKF